MKWLAGMTITADRLGQGDPTDITTYTPAVTNGGTATWSTQIGYYTITDNWVDVTIYLIQSAAGSGTGLVTVAMPTNVDRSTRNILLVHSESNGVGTAGQGSELTSAIRGGECVFLTGGSGALSDRIRVDLGAGNEANMQGSNLLNGGLLTISGRYRKA